MISEGKNKTFYSLVSMNQFIVTVVIVIVFALFFAFPSFTYALTISISNLPSEINFNQETEVGLYFSCSGCGDNSYMRGVFYHSGTNYFGFTQNNSGSWIGSETDRSLYFNISKADLIDASWSGELKVKPDPQDTAFSGTGEYLFKIGRYTSSSDSSADWSNELTIKIIGPTPSPTVTSTPTQTATATSTITPTSTPTKTATAVATSTKTATAKPTSTPTPTELEQFETIQPSNHVTITPTGIVAGVSTTKKSPILSIFFILFGLGFLGYGGYLIYNKQKHEVS